MKTKLSAIAASILLVGAGGVGAAAMQVHAQDGQNQNTVATTAATTGTLSATVQSDIQDSELSDDSDAVVTGASLDATASHEQGDQSEQDNQDSEDGQDSGGDN